MSPRKGRDDKRMSRGVQSRERQRRARLDPQVWRRRLRGAERGAIVRDAPLRIALAYPNPYHTAMSSLGYQVIYRQLNSRPFASCERVVLPEDVEHWRKQGHAPVGLESGRPLGAFDVVALSVAYDLDLPGIFELLDLAGIPALRRERGEHHPPILLGGPITASNVLPLGPFIDLAVVGDGELAVERLLDVLADGPTHAALMEGAATIPGVWVPELHGDRIPPVQKVTAGALPAYGQSLTPDTELSEMFVVEASRGCPRYCRFCLVRAPESPMRESVLETVLQRVPEEAPRVGFVGAAVSEWSGIREALRRVIDSGRGVGVSSLRADRLDEELVDLLARGGYRTMTVAADAPSQRLRGKLAKGLRTRHLRRSAELARRFGLTRLKLYVIVGLPGETEEDIDELLELTRELSALLPVALGISPLVPKLHTPLADAPFGGIKPLEVRLHRIREALGGAADVRSVSARWAWVEWRMSQGGTEAGLAAWEAWRSGGRFADWRRALDGAEEREGLSPALEAAERHALWQAARMK